MIAEPYTKRMNAIFEVDQAAAFLQCAAGIAEAAGIPRARWAQELREDPGNIGLTTGLGWYVTKHSIGLWSTTPSERGFARPDLSVEQAAIDATALPQAQPATVGPATVDGWTVIHDREAARPAWWPTPPPPTAAGWWSAGTIRRWAPSCPAASWSARGSPSFPRGEGPAAFEQG